eukprot:CAMPEP_0195289564 /NCGR_PEP_ID=MMETSP0707-20130614/5791_1 /TAXON_ID=33640 /ORGANISM="Asterionellopsis glacialis, Strain CCMP134" /LENGTH=481 /DNA_ID=CAMNT_0040349585 /DNA_START=150 /DNA_END=1592 /DNA_ORIENTATION=+
MSAVHDASNSAIQLYDVLIIGGGVVGSAILRACTLLGWSCALVEANADLLSNASGSNSGIACTGVDASPGTLERALIRDSISQIRMFCREHNIPNRECGSLVCQWPWDGVETSVMEDKDEENGTKCSTSVDDVGQLGVTPPLVRVLTESWDAGDTHAKMMTAAQLKRMEMNLCNDSEGAVHIPGEIVVDPWLYSIALAVHARENGGTIYTNFCFDAERSFFDATTKMWTVFRRRDHQNNDSDIENEEDSEGESLSSSPSADRPDTIQARTIVNAAGIQADLLQSATGDCPKPSWEARPRRGQYRIFSSNAETKITHPIQPVPSQRTKGIFVFSTLYDQIVVGPTALDQESRTDRTADPEVATTLTEHVKRLIPKLDPETAHVGEYVGIRPGTDHRDYQIMMYPEKNWVVAAGIRSTGLTGSLGIGRHVTQLLKSILPNPEPKKTIKTTPLPNVQELVAEYQFRGDEMVTIHGNLYRVTHPI